MKKIWILLFSGLATGLTGQGLYFPPVAGNDWDTMSPQSLNWCPENIEVLYDFLENNNTKAFILLKDGRIVLEKYFGAHTQNALWYWASAGKTLTSFMTGIAQQDGFLSISEPTSAYLGAGWTDCTPAQEEQITVRHQLTMTSGLDDGVPDPYCTIDSCLVYKADAGDRWAYHNGPYTLLDQVIESATGTTLNAYMLQKLKSPTGMTGSFIPVDYNNVFFSTARSMARFGLLILNNGNWDGNQIMTDQTYFQDMTHTSQSLNLSYGYLWWLNGAASFMVPGSQFVFNGPLSPNAPPDMIAALGKNGQFLNVVHSQNLVWLRMGDEPDGVEVPFLLNDQVWEYLNELPCAPVGISETESGDDLLVLTANPAGSTLTIKSLLPVTGVQVFDTAGRLIRVYRCDAAQTEVTQDLSVPGMSFIKINLSNGQTVVKSVFLP